MDNENAEISTKTDIFGNAQTDTTGEPIQEVKTEGSQSYEVSTKTDIFGNAQTDTTGEPIKQVTPQS